MPIPRRPRGDRTKDASGRIKQRQDRRADGDVQAVAQEEICTQPRMPHVDFNAADLDLQYPSLHAPEELELDDLTKLEDEQLYHAGMKVVQKVLNEMATAGRTRKAGAPNAHAATSAGGASRLQHGQQQARVGQRMK